MHAKEECRRRRTGCGAGLVALALAVIPQPLVDVGDTERGTPKHTIAHLYVNSDLGFGPSYGFNT